MDVYVKGKRVRVAPSSAIGKGGEADVFDLGDGTVLKLYKTPDHPDYAGLPAEQDAARERLEVHQHKLPALPRDLPDGVVAPLDLATDRRGQRVVGYTMPFVVGAEVLLRYAEPAARRAGLAAADAISALVDLHRIVEALHARGVVIGDFNDLNVLVEVGRRRAGPAGDEARAFLIDADSLQFGPFPCPVYSERFVDPLLCDASLTRPVPVRPHTPDSDWYAFAVMLMASLVCVGPHGGVYHPSDPAARIPQSARPLRRITVFHPEVTYPRPAIPLRALPDDLLDELARVFVQDHRGVFPRRLLDDLRFTRCAACGAEHARAVCPSCVFTAKAAVKETTTVRGRVTATRVFATSGTIVCAAMAEGSLLWLAHEGGRFVREDGSVVLHGDLDPSLVFAIQGRTTLVGRGASAVVLGPDRPPERFAVDVARGRSVLAANARRRFWARGGVLLRGALGTGGESLEDRLAHEDGARIGEVLAGQTRLWVGPHFGLGFYRAGAVSVSFVFDAERGGLLDTVKLPFLPGEIFDADCVFDQGGLGGREVGAFPESAEGTLRGPHRSPPIVNSQGGLGGREVGAFPESAEGTLRGPHRSPPIVNSDRAFVLLAARHRGRTVHQCAVVTSAGAVEAAAEAAADDGGWLGVLRGKCAAGGCLLAATDAGIVRVEPRGGALVETRRFPDTEPFVDPATRLFAGRDGLFAVGDSEILKLRIA